VRRRTTKTSVRARLTCQLRAATIQPMDDEERLDPEATKRQGPSLETLPLAGFSRRRVAILVAGLVALWLVGVFARQVGDASAAAAHADALRARNAAAQAQIAVLQEELRLVQRPAFVGDEARGYGLGTASEVPFTVDPAAPPLPGNAPGSVGIREAASSPARTPLDAWLEVLFGRRAGN
jgi:hypothetical protein